MHGITCKFTVTSITPDGSNPDMKHIRMDARYDESLPEDRRFSKWTPNGSLTLTITNPAANEQIVVGREFYLTLMPCIEAMTPTPIGACPDSPVPAAHA